MEEMQTAKDTYLVNSHFISLTISETVTIQTYVIIMIMMIMMMMMMMVMSVHDCQFCIKNLYLDLVTFSSHKLTSIYFRQNARANIYTHET